jgi:cytochrome c oxidase assembly protein subunit 15
MAVWYRSHQVPFMLVVIVFMIIATGGWVRISDAGESCPDWPTCFGTWGFDVSAEDQKQWWEENPDEVDSRGAEHRYTSDQIFTEWLHRGLVGIIGILVIYSHYTAWSLRNEIGEKTYKLHYLATVLLVMQAVVGYVTVDLDNAPWTVALHLFMALMFTTSLMAVGLLWWQKQTGLPNYLTVGNEKILNIIWYMMLFILIQLLIGAFLSSGYHRGACGVGMWNGWPLCHGKIIPSLTQVGTIIQFVHRISAILVAGLLFWGRQEIRDNDGKSMLTVLIDFSLGFYILNLGIGGLYLISAGNGEFPGWVSLLHLLIGTATFLVIAWAYLICNTSQKVVNNG